MKRLLIVLSVMSFLAAYADETEKAPEGGEEREPVEGEVREAMFGGRRVKIVREGGEWVMDSNAGSDRAWTNDVVVAHKPTDEFLDFNGEKLSWAQIDEHIELLMLNAPLNLPPQATAEDVEKVMIVTKRQYAMRLGEMYVRNALLAQKAREEGLVVEAAELSTALTNSVKRISRRNRDRFLATITKPDSYFYRNQENYLLTRKYRDAVLSGPVEVPPEMVAVAIAEREEERKALEKANAALRPAMEKWLAEIRAGVRDFAETAEMESDSSETDADGNMGDFTREEAEESLPEPIRAFAFAASTNTVSDVMETPTEYHIIKILARHYDPAEDDGSISPGEDGVKAPTSVTLAAIVKEKFELPDPLTEDEAREEVRKQLLGARFEKAQLDALKAAKVSSVYPIRIKSKQELERRAKERARRLQDNEAQNQGRDGGAAHAQAPTAQ